MKIRPLLFSASLVANLLLATALFLHKPAQVSPAPSGPAASLDSHRTSNRGRAGQTSAQAESAWARFPSDDLPAFVAALRAEGFPTALIQSLARARISRQFAPRRAAVLAQAPERPFWEPGAEEDPRIREQLIQITKEESDAVKGLVVTGEAESAKAMQDYAAEQMHFQNPNLSDEKISGILRIRETFNKQRDDLHAPDGTFRDLAGSEKTQAIDQAQQEAMAQLLTPDELQEYDLRSNRVAAGLRSQLTAFGTTKEEFLALYAIKQSYEDRLYPSEPTGKSAQEDEQAHTELLRQQDTEIKAALGDARFAEYQRAIDWSYRQTMQLVSRLALPPETANQVYAVQQEIQTRAQAVRSNRDLSPAESSAQLAALSAETQAKVTTALGEAGFAAYRRYGGDWMQALAPPSSPAPPGETILTRIR